METRSGVLLLSVLPEAHFSLLSALSRRGIPTHVARSGQRAVQKLKARPILVLVDLVHGAALDRHSVDQLNATRTSSTLIGVHDGDLGRFAGEFEDLAVDGFCRADDWSLVVELAGENFDLVATNTRH